jgi:NAD(P)H-dependent FMN reductase
MGDVMEKPRIGIIISTIREGRFGDKPAQWILDIASKRTDFDFEIVDLRDYPLPLLGETESPAYDGSSKSEVATRWGRKMAELDVYLFVTAEYNHGVPGALKNALDHVYPECNKKPAAFVGYGGVGGARAVEQLRLICIEFQMAPTRTAVHIGVEPYLGVTQEGKELSDFDFLDKSAVSTLDELAWWTQTLKVGRAKAAKPVAAKPVGAAR